MPVRWQKINSNGNQTGDAARLCWLSKSPSSETLAVNPLDLICIQILVGTESMARDDFFSSVVRKRSNTVAGRCLEPR